MAKAYLAAALLVLAVVGLATAFSAAARAASVSQKQLQYYKSIYPCTKCHAHMNLTGFVKVVPFHHIDLTKGPHRGLYCSNCHIPPTFIKLRGGAIVAIPGFQNETMLKQTNKLCAICHPREYRDYMDLVHGNKTFTCPGGKVEIIYGYKGIHYYFHICPNGYVHLKTEPARACVQCHNPHDPTFYPLPPLPTPSERPKPPNETAIAIGDIAAAIGGLIAVVFALTMPKYVAARRER